MLRASLKRSASSPTVMLQGLTSGSELKARVSETVVVSINVDYYNCQYLVSAVNLLRKDKNSSEILKKLPVENPENKVYRVKPSSYSLSFIVSKMPTAQITLSLEEVVALIKELDEHTKKNKRIIKEHAKKMSFIAAYFYLRRVNKNVYDDELIVAKATAFLIQKVQEKLKSEIILPKIIVQPEDEEIPLNFIRRCVLKGKKYFLDVKNKIIKKLHWIFKKKTDGTETNVKVSDSNSYKDWIKFFIVMSFHFIPMFYMSFYFAAESMESLTPYLFFVSPHVMAALGVVCTINILAGTVCFLGPKLMNWFKIHFSDTRPSLHSVYKEQLESIQSIDAQLLNHNNLSSRAYEKYFQFSEKVAKIPSQNIEESSLTTIATWSLTALMAVESFSSSIMMGATLLGLILGAFTFSTVTPPILMAFVGSHLISVFLISLPMAICESVVAYVWRVSSTSALLDREKDERDAVEKMRLEYKAKQPGIHVRLANYLKDKKKVDSTFKEADPVKQDATNSGSNEVYEKKSTAYKSEKVSHIGIVETHSLSF